MNNNHGRRRTRRVRQQRKQQKTQIGRILLTVGLMALIAVVSIGGTLAWLTAETSEIKNTFTAAGIAVELTETPNADSDTDDDEVLDHWKAQLVPGKIYAKNPKVAVKDTNVDIYLFVKFEEKNNPTTYLDYQSTLTVANGWTQGDGTIIPNTVWYRKVDANTNPSWNLLVGEGEGNLKDGFVTVKSSLTKDQTQPTNLPELVYTAYAIQTEGSATAADGWAKLNP